MHLCFSKKGISPDTTQLTCISSLYNVILLFTGHLFKHKWENAMTIDQYSWGYRRNARLRDYLSIEKLLDTFIKTVR